MAKASGVRSAGLLTGAWCGASYGIRTGFSEKPACPARRPRSPPTPSHCSLRSRCFTASFARCAALDPLLVRNRSVPQAGPTLPMSSG